MRMRVAQAAVAKRPAVSSAAASQPSCERKMRWDVVKTATLRLTCSLDSEKIKVLKIGSIVTSLERRGNRVHCETGGWASIESKDGNVLLRERKPSKNQQPRRNQQPSQDDMESLPLAERVRLKQPAAEGAGSLASFSSVRVRIDPASLRHVLP